MKKLYFTTLLLLLLLSLSKAQLMIHVGDKIGTDMIVTAVDDTETHFWVGTNKGLYKVNKSNKKDVEFTTANSPLQSNYITSICCRANGNIWIGTPNGIVRYNGYTFDVVDTDNSKMPENYTTDLKEDSNGDLWIGTVSNGLVKVHGNNTFLVYNNATPTFTNNIALESSLVKK